MQQELPFSSQIQVEFKWVFNLIDKYADEESKN